MDQGAVVVTGPGWPSERGWLVLGAMLIFTYVLTLLAFIPRLEESQLFAALAGGVAGAILRDVFGMWTASTKAGSELATKAMDTLQNQTSSTSNAAGSPGAEQAADQVADAATEEAKKIKGAK
jgi:hypothetical protein